VSENKLGRGVMGRKSMVASFNQIENSGQHELKTRGKTRMNKGEKRTGFGRKTATKNIAGDNR